MTLKLVASNTEEEIKNTLLGKQPIFLKCKRCGHKWTITIAKASDNPECPRCQG